MCTAECRANINRSVMSHGDNGHKTPCQSQTDARPRHRLHPKRLDMLPRNRQRRIRLPKSQHHLTARQQRELTVCQPAIKQSSSQERTVYDQRQGQS